MAVELLTAEEIAHFKREGYVIKYGLLDPGLLAACRARLWTSFPLRIRRDDPASWVGPLLPEEETTSGHHGIMRNSRAGFSWRERVAGGEQLMLDLLPNTLMPIAEQLLGQGKVQPATGESVGTMLGVPDDENFPAVLAEVAASSDVGIKPLCARYLDTLGDIGITKQADASLHDIFVVGTRGRGIYCTLPQPPGTERVKEAGGGHNDLHPFQLGVEAYIDDVPPNGGGLVLWPGAHRRVFSTYERQHSQTQRDRQGLSGSVLQQVAKDTKAVDTYGPAGTVVFWHHRGMHNAGTNHSQRMRQAVLYEFAKVDINDGPPPADMWRDWSAEVRAVAPDVGPLPPPDEGRRGEGGPKL